MNLPGTLESLLDLLLGCDIALGELVFYSFEPGKAFDGHTIFAPESANAVCNRLLSNDKVRLIERDSLPEPSWWLLEYGDEFEFTLSVFCWKPAPGVPKSSQMGEVSLRYLSKTQQYEFGKHLKHRQTKWAKTYSDSYFNLLNLRNERFGSYPHLRST